MFDVVVMGVSVSGVIACCSDGGILAVVLVCVDGVFGEYCRLYFWWSIRWWVVCVVGDMWGCWWVVLAVIVLYNYRL